MKRTIRRALRLLPQVAALACIQRTAAGQTTVPDSSFHVTGTTFGGHSTNPSDTATYGASSALQNGGKIDVMHTLHRHNGHNGIPPDQTGTATCLKSVNPEIGRIHMLESGFLMLFGSGFLLIGLMSLRHRLHARRLMTP